MTKESQLQKPARRQFVKKAAYVAPAILTLVATPGHATLGSFKSEPGSIKSMPLGKEES